MIGPMTESRPMCAWTGLSAANSPCISVGVTLLAPYRLLTGPETSSIGALIAQMNLCNHRDRREVVFRTGGMGASSIDVAQNLSVSTYCSSQ